MEMLPVDRVVAGLPAAVADAKADNWAAAARADHDHRYGAQVGVDPGADRREDGRP
jgi:hypothetical protein